MTKILLILCVRYSSKCLIYNSLLNQVCLWVAASLPSWCQYPPFHCSRICKALLSAAPSSGSPKEAQVQHSKRWLCLHTSCDKSLTTSSIAGEFGLLESSGFDITVVFEIHHGSEDKLISELCGQGLPLKSHHKTVLRNSERGA